MCSNYEKQLQAIQGQEAETRDQVRVRRFFVLLEACGDVWQEESLLLSWKCPLRECPSLAGEEAAGDAPSGQRSAGEDDDGETESGGFDESGKRRNSRQGLDAVNVLTTLCRSLQVSA